MRVCYPGSFDPPTVGHRAIVRAVLHRGVDRLDLVLSADPLGKPSASPIDERAAHLRRLLAGEARAAVVVTEHRLLADIAAGYDVLVVGADKWAQVNDPAWYGDSEPARDAALQALPNVLVVPRDGFELPQGVELLAIHPDLQRVSSTDARAGRDDWIWEG